MSVSQATEGFISTGSGATYRMRGFDSVLLRIVYWNSPIVDGAGAAYTGPGTVSDVVVVDAVGQKNP